jgi:YHS domain-containing protein
MFIRLIIFIFFVYLIYKIIKMAGHRKEGEETKASSVSEDLVEDPFCHKYVPISQAHVKEINGKKHYFCSWECFDKYQSK